MAGRIDVKGIESRLVEYQVEIDLNAKCIKYLTGISELERYVATLTDNVESCWDYVDQLASLAQIHLKSAAQYHQFFHEANELESRIERQIIIAENRQDLNSGHWTYKEASQLAKEIREQLDVMRNLWNRSKALVNLSSHIVPMRLRLGGVAKGMTVDTQTERPVMVRAMISLVGPNYSIQQGEHLRLIDNREDARVWKVQTSTGIAIVPSVCFWLTGNDIDATNRAIAIKKKCRTVWLEILERDRQHLYETFTLLMTHLASEEHIYCTNNDALNDLLQDMRILLPKSGLNDGRLQSAVEKFYRKVIVKTAMEQIHTSGLVLQEPDLVGMRAPLLRLQDHLESIHEMDAELKIIDERIAEYLSEVDHKREQVYNSIELLESLMGKSQIELKDIMEELGQWRRTSPVQEMRLKYIRVPKAKHYMEFYPELAEALQSPLGGFRSRSQPDTVQDPPRDRHKSRNTSRDKDYRRIRSAVSKLDAITQIGRQSKLAGTQYSSQSDLTAWQRPPSILKRSKTTQRSFKCPTQLTAMTQIGRACKEFGSQVDNVMLRTLDTEPNVYINPEDTNLQPYALTSNNYMNFASQYRFSHASSRTAVQQVNVYTHQRIVKHDAEGRYAKFYQLSEEPSALFSDVLVCKRIQVVVPNLNPKENLYTQIDVYKNVEDVEVGDTALYNSNMNSYAQITTHPIFDSSEVVTQVGVTQSNRTSNLHRKLSPVRMVPESYAVDHTRNISADVEELVTQSGERIIWPQTDYPTMTNPMSTSTIIFRNTVQPITKLDTINKEFRAVTPVSDSEFQVGRLYSSNLSQTLKVQATQEAVVRPIAIMEYEAVMRKPPEVGLTEAQAAPVYHDKKLQFSVEPELCEMVAEPAKGDNKKVQVALEMRRKQFNVSCGAVLKPETSWKKVQIEHLDPLLRMPTRQEPVFAPPLSPSPWMHEAGCECKPVMRDSSCLATEPANGVDKQVQVALEMRREQFDVTCDAVLKPETFSKKILVEDLNPPLLMSTRQDPVFAPPPPTVEYADTTCDVLPGPEPNDAFVQADPVPQVKAPMFSKRLQASMTQLHIDYCQTGVSLQSSLSSLAEPAPAISPVLAPVVKSAPHLPATDYEDRGYDAISGLQYYDAFLQSAPTVTSLLTSTCQTKAITRPTLLYFTAQCVNIGTSELTESSKTLNLPADFLTFAKSQTITPVYAVKSTQFATEIKYEKKLQVSPEPLNFTLCQTRPFDYVDSRPRHQNDMWVQAELPAKRLPCRGIRIQVGLPHMQKSDGSIQSTPVVMDGTTQAFDQEENQFIKVVEQPKVEAKPPTKPIDDDNIFSFTRQAVARVTRSSSRTSSGLIPCKMQVFASPKQVSVSMPAQLNVHFDEANIATTEQPIYQQEPICSKPPGRYATRRRSPSSRNFSTRRNRSAESIDDYEAYVNRGICRNFVSDHELYTGTAYEHLIQHAGFQQYQVEQRCTDTLEAYVRQLDYETVHRTLAELARALELEEQEVTSYADHSCSKRPRLHDARTQYTSTTSLMNFHQNYYTSSAFKSNKSVQEGNSFVRWTPLTPGEQVSIVYQSELSVTEENFLCYGKEDVESPGKQLVKWVRKAEPLTKYQPEAVRPRQETASDEFMKVRALSAYCSDVELQESGIKTNYSAYDAFTLVSWQTNDRGDGRLELSTLGRLLRLTLVGARLPGSADIIAAADAFYRGILRIVYLDEESSTMLSFPAAINTGHVIVEKQYPPGVGIAIRGDQDRYPVMSEVVWTTPELRHRSYKVNYIRKSETQKIDVLTALNEGIIEQYSGEIVNITLGPSTNMADPIHEARESSVGSGDTVQRRRNPERFNINEAILNDILNVEFDGQETSVPVDLTTEGTQDSNGSKSGSEEHSDVDI